MKKPPCDTNVVNHCSLATEDGQSIALAHYRKGFPILIIIAHGFYNNKDTVLFREIAERISRYDDVITFDFRGHGKSSGLFSWTSREPKDLKAVVSYAKKTGYLKIGIMGFSLGASVALIEASRNPDIDSLIAVSAPYDFWKINYHFWEPDMLEDLKLNMGKKGKGKGMRPSSPFFKKVRPLDIVDKICPRPVLFIHGEKDWLIKPVHSKRLFEKAGDPKGLKIFEGAGHAERIFDCFPDQFIAICAHWFKETL